MDTNLQHTTATAMTQDACAHSNVVVAFNWETTVFILVCLLIYLLLIRFPRKS